MRRDGERARRLDIWWQAGTRGETHGDSGFRVDYENLALVSEANEEDGRWTMTVRGDVAAHKFSACYLRDGVFVACQAVNMAKDFLQSKKLIQAKARPDPAKLADANVALKDL